MRDDRLNDIEDRARAVFDASVERIDAATRSRLTQARHAALAELERPTALLASWKPAVVVAAVAVLAVGLWLGPGGSGQPELPGVEDLELISAGEDLDMLGEEPEFYAWAASVVASGDGVG
jgi:hypothetical protein